MKLILIKSLKHLFLIENLRINMDYFFEVFVDLIQKEMYILYL